MSGAKRATAVLFVAALALGAPDAVRADSPRAEALRAEFQGRKRQVLVEDAQRHLKLGVWCRDAGLVPQATAEFVRAVEVAEGKHPGAVKLLALMRSLDDEFWRKRRENPGKGILRAYEKRARAADADTLRDRTALAKWATKHDELAEEAHGEWVAIVRGTDVPLEADAEGRIRLPKGFVPAGPSARILAEAVRMNGVPRVRDEMLARLPDVKDMHEAASDELRVRSQRSLEEADALLALCSAALAPLEDDMGGRPPRRLDVVVLADRKTYETYLNAAGLSSHVAATGVADGGTLSAVICGEALPPVTLHGVALHELAHLFQNALTRAVMPSWYSEGYAESFGGLGTFAWDGTKLETGRRMSGPTVDSLRTPEGYIPLAEMLSGDALALIQTEKGKAARFYAEAWALFSWFRTAAKPAWRERFSAWEARCRGTAIGAVPGEPNGRDMAPATASFAAAFDADLSAIEHEFRLWLAKP
jgi:hypothetical protein